MKIEIPSLRERREDILELIDFFIDFFSKKMNKKVEKISASFYERLKQYDFPGNIRELRNVIERSIILSEGGFLGDNLLPHEFFSESIKENADSLKLEDIEKQHIISVLEKTNNNKTKAAEALGIGLTTLYRKIQTYGLE